MKKYSHIIIITHGSGGNSTNTVLFCKNIYRKNIIHISDEKHNYKLPVEF